MIISKISVSVDVKLILLSGYTQNFGVKRSN